MGGMGGTRGQPGHHSPNIGGSVSSKRTKTETDGEPMPTAAISISHQKLSRVTMNLPCPSRPRRIYTLNKTPPLATP